MPALDACTVNKTTTLNIAMIAVIQDNFAFVFMLFFLFNRFSVFGSASKLRNHPVLKAKIDGLFVVRFLWNARVFLAHRLRGKLIGRRDAVCHDLEFSIPPNAKAARVRIAISVRFIQFLLFLFDPSVIYTTDKA